MAPLMTRREGDYYKHTHRVVAAAHAVGVTFNEMFAEILGKQTGTSHGRGGVNHIARLDKGCIRHRRLPGRRHRGGNSGAGKSLPST